MDIRTINNIRCYSGDIAPESGVVFVFGSNPEGRHGAGAAKVARERFGAVYGRGEGLQGNAYALPTKDLRVTENRGFRSISPETITESIKKLYETARQHPDKSFCIAYRNTDRASLNGYTGIEMMRMFNAAGPMPANVIVSEEWAKTGILKKNAESEFLTEGNDSILKQYDAYRVVAPGVNLAVDDGRKEAVAMTILQKCSKLGLDNEAAFKARFSTNPKKELAKETPVKAHSVTADGPTWTPCRRNDGLMNYRDAAGHVLLKNWVDDALPFKDGKAECRIGKTGYIIDTKGIVIDRARWTAQSQSNTNGPKI